MPAPTGAAPLAALKQWLAISTPAEDALLERLLAVAYQTCAAYIGGAGLADDWGEVSAPLREGIVRFAAHLYRDRDAASTREPPAAVAALWRPWRELRL
jgi:uncharacterized iron-regulated protein